MIWNIQRYLGLLVLFSCKFLVEIKLAWKRSGAGHKISNSHISSIQKKLLVLRSVVYIFKHWWSISRDKLPWSINHTPTFPLHWFYVLIHTFDAHNMNTVMFNFICLLDWATGCPDSWLNTISVCVCEGVPERLAFELMSWVNHMAFPTVGGGGRGQSVQGLNRTKRQKKFELALPDCLICNINLLLPFMLPILKSSELDWKIHHQSPSLGQHQASWVSTLQMAASIITGTAL